MVAREAALTVTRCACEVLCVRVSVCEVVPCPWAGWKLWQPVLEPRPVRHTCALWRVGPKDACKKGLCKARACVAARKPLRTATCTLGYRGSNGTLGILQFQQQQAGGRRVSFVPCGMRISAISRWASNGGPVLREQCPPGSGRGRSPKLG